MHDELKSLREIAGTPELGNLTIVAENAREVWTWRWLDDIGRDLHSSLRTLRRYPGVTAIALVSLALGIGANTMVFSFLNELVFRPFRFSDADRLVRFSVSVSPSECAEVRGSGIFEESGCYADNISSSIAGHDAAPSSPEHLIGDLLTAGLPRALGINPLIGRWFSESDEVEGAPRVILISYGLWQRRFGASPEILGRAVRMDGDLATIIGVMPSDFEFGNPNVDYWAAFRPYQHQSRTRMLGVVARLKQDATIQSAQVATDAFSRHLAENSATPNSDWHIVLEPLTETRYGTALSGGMLLLQATVAAVLLIACANVAGLLLAQAGAQQRELAVRAALGSGTWRIVRQLFVYSFLLAVAGGGLGLAAGWAGVRLMTNVVIPFAVTSYGEAGGGGWPRLIYEVGVDRNVLIFTFLVSMACGLVAGIAPAFQVSRAHPLDVLRESNRSATTSASRQRLRSVFVTGQIALALMLLVTAGLMLKGLMRVMSEDIGFDTAELVTTQLQLPDHSFRRPTGKTLDSGSLGMNIDPQMRINVERMRQNLAEISGVTAASGIAMFAPMSGSLAVPVRAEGSSAQQRPQFLPILPEYFKSLQVAVEQGREFQTTDTAEAAAVAVINTTMARRLWPNGDALGKTVELDTPLVPNDAPRIIVGVVSDINQYEGQHDRLQLYVPYSQLPLIHDERLTNHLRDLTFVLRSRRPVHELTKSIESAIAEVDTSQAISRIRTMQQTAFGAAQRRRVYATVLGTFGAIAVLLAVIGVYGVMSNLVTQRTNELGIRMALGAAPAQLRHLVIRHASVLIGCGLFVGILGSLAVARAIQSALYGMSPNDPVTFSVSAILVGVIAFAASYLPAWRASRISAMTALRHN